MSQYIQKTGMKKIAFVVDGSEEAGSGHYRRCLLLAEALIKKNFKIFFVEDFLSENVKLTIKIKKLLFISKQNLLLNLRDYKYIIIDHYNTSVSLERKLNQQYNKVIIIDDLANRKHSCDIIINPTYGAKNRDYKDFLDKKTTFLMGPKYSFLNDCFKDVRKKKIKNNLSEVKKVHLFFGSNDASYFILKILKEILIKYIDLEFNLVITKKYLRKNKLKNLEKKFTNFYLYEDVINMAKSMQHCDVAIGAPGITLAERGVLGIPSLYCAINKNQIKILKRLQANGIIDYIGFIEKVSVDEFLSSLDIFLSNKKRLTKMSKKSFKIFSDNGLRNIIEYIT